jgi:hypothetical protein
VFRGIPLLKASLSRVASQALKVDSGATAIEIEEQTKLRASTTTIAIIRRTLWKWALIFIADSNASVVGVFELQEFE